MEKKQLRSGFTTGTCAAGAARAAASLLFTGIWTPQVEIMTPKGIVARLTAAVTECAAGRAVCAVRKDAGDDPDVTDQALIYASVEYIDDGKKEEKDRDEGKRWYQSGNIFLTGGPGIGVVTKPGLSCPVGKHAINPVPRQMIFEQVQEAALSAGCNRRLLVTVWIPDGERLAAKTFNPKLGIEGGISILGTSGIVEPMSEAALTATIRLELHMKAEAGKKAVILTPGNYGETFLKETLGLSLSQGVSCSNFVADSVEMAGEEGIHEILFVGHLGKLIKVAGGVRNTHSKYGDRRMEILLDCIRQAGPPGEGWEALKDQILGSNTTEEAAGHLREARMAEPVMEIVVNRIRKNLERWQDGKLHAEVVTFVSGFDLLGMTEGAKTMIAAFREQKEKEEQESE